MLATCKGPAIPTVEETETGLDAVAPGPEMFKVRLLGENVRFCASAVSG
jgi:hypothetical protein